VPPQKLPTIDKRSVSLDELLDNIKKIFDEVKLSQERSDLIQAIDQAILRSTLSPNEVLNLIVAKGLSKTGSYHGQIVRYRHNELVVVASTEDDHINEKLPLDKSLCGKAITTGHYQHIPDVSKLPEDEYVRYHKETQSELVLLIKAEHSGKILGVLDLERKEPGEFDPKSIEFARLLAGQAAIAITHSQTWSGVNTLYDISTSLLSGDLSLEQSYQQILNTILDQFDFEYGQILRLIGDEFIILASSSHQDVGLRPGKNTSICGRYLITEGNREIKIINDIKKSPYKDFYLGLLKSEKGRPMRSEMIVPLIDDDRLIGALNLESPRIGVFSDLDRSLLGVLGSLMTSAISATFNRRNITNQDRTREANLALTRLGAVAQTFLHNYGNKISNALPGHHGRKSCPNMAFL
jgi:putative methionine-R-sulfoxide reductase with GAF domain